jgi:hypothetical protein
MSTYAAIPVWERYAQGQCRQKDQEPQNKPSGHGPILLPGVGTGNFGLGIEQDDYEPLSKLPLGI